MGFLRRLLRRKKPRSPTRSPSEQDLIFSHIWHHVAFTGDPQYPPQKDRKNVLIVQMGKVASLALKSAINQSGLNGFHVHSICAEQQLASLRSVLRAEPSVHLAGHVYRQLAHRTALSMMLAWYRRNKQHKGSRLKVVTLTRDPVDWLRSSFVQRRQRELPALRAWRQSYGPPIGRTEDDIAATRDFFRELAALAAETRPSIDLAAARAAVTGRAAEKGPHADLFAYHLRRCLLPLGWFDDEILPTFGLDVLAEPCLRQHGFVILENDYAEIITVRFEDLARCTAEIARFLGLSNLVLPRRNVSADKPTGPAFVSAIHSALDSPEGRAFERELRESRYGRACGYDQPRRTSVMEAP